MYSKTLEPKINLLFDEMNKRVMEILSSETSLKAACSAISKFVASETTTRSETMLSDMCNVLSANMMDAISDAALRNKFRYADLEQEIHNKYSFSLPSEGIDFEEANRVFLSLVASAGTTVIGGLLIYALSPTVPTLPIALVVAASVSAFCVYYFKRVPNANKKKFMSAVESYLQDVKLSYIVWFGEVENYFNKRAEEICR